MTTISGSVRSHERAHPTPTKYVAIALVLAALTMIEVAAVYMRALEPVLILILLVLSATKFAIVAMFYMHLRFDHRLFSALFVGGLLLASSLLVSLMALFGVLVR